MVGGKKIKRRHIFHGMRNYMKFKFQLSQHRHSHHLWMDYDRFCAATTELSSYNRDCVACKAPNIFHLARYRRSLMAAVISPRSAITIRIKLERGIAGENRIQSPESPDFAYLTYENRILREKFSKCWYLPTRCCWDSCDSFILKLLLTVPLISLYPLPYPTLHAHMG